MPQAFSRTLRSLGKDDGREAARWLAAGAALLLGWGVWFCLARVTERIASTSARIEVEQTAHRLDTPLAATVVMSKFELGALVSAGEVVVELDCEPQRRRLLEARAVLEGIEPELAAVRRAIDAEVRASESDERAALWSLRTAQAQSEQADIDAAYSGSEVQRTLQLAKNGLITGAEVERVKTDAERQHASQRAAALGVRRQRDQRHTSVSRAAVTIEALRRDLAALEGRRGAASARVAELSYEIARCQIRSPVAGRVGSHRSVRTGAFVQEGETLGTIVPPGKLRVVASFDPSLALGRIRPDQSARLRIASYPWTEFGSLDARVERVASEPDAGGLRVELGVAPGPGSRIALEHGLTGSVEVDVLELSPLALMLRSIGRFMSTEPRLSVEP